MKLFKDGVEVGSAGKSGALGTNSGVEVTIGQTPDGYGTFDGSIDEVRVYNRVLTAQEIDTLINGAPPPLAPPKNLRFK